jgi:hypothetical protein
LYISQQFSCFKGTRIQISVLGSAFSINFIKKLKKKMAFVIPYLFLVRNLNDFYWEKELKPHKRLNKLRNLSLASNFF